MFALSAQASDCDFNSITVTPTNLKAGYTGFDWYEIRAQVTVDKYFMFRATSKSKTLRLPTLAASHSIQLGEVLRLSCDEFSKMKEEAFADYVERGVEEGLTKPDVVDDDFKLTLLFYGVNRGHLSRILYNLLSFDFGKRMSDGTALDREDLSLSQAMNGTNLELIDDGKTLMFRKEAESTKAKLSLQVKGN
jgi:hypothetical protein